MGRKQGPRELLTFTTEEVVLSTQVTLHAIIPRPKRLSVP